MEPIAKLADEYLDDLNTIKNEKNEEDVKRFFIADTIKYLETKRSDVDILVKIADKLRFDKSFMDYNTIKDILKLYRDLYNQRVSDIKLICEIEDRLVSIFEKTLD